LILDGEPLITPLSRGPLGIRQYGERNKQAAGKDIVLHAPKLFAGNFVMTPSDFSRVVAEGLSKDFDGIKQFFSGVIRANAAMTVENRSANQAMNSNKDGNIADSAMAKVSNEPVVTVTGGIKLAKETGPVIADILTQLEQMKVLEARGHTWPDYILAYEGPDSATARLLLNDKDSPAKPLPINPAGAWVERKDIPALKTWLQGLQRDINNVTGVAIALFGAVDDEIVPGKKLSSEEIKEYRRIFASMENVGYEEIFKRIETADYQGALRLVEHALNQIQLKTGVRSKDQRKLVGILADLERRLQELGAVSSDEAMIHGGIDLNATNMSLSVSKDAQGGVTVTFDPALIDRIRKEGVRSVVPVIINIVPVADIKPLLGL
jgi:hypothetical protein